MEVVLDDVGGPLGLEEIFEAASAFSQDEVTSLNALKQAQGKLQVISRLVEAFAFQELFAVRASRHLTSVALKAGFGSHVEGSGVTLPDRRYGARDGNVLGRSGAAGTALYNSQRYAESSE